MCAIITASGATAVPETVAIDNFPARQWTGRAYATSPSAPAPRPAPARFRPRRDGAPVPVVRQEADGFAKGGREFQSLAGVFYFFDRGDNDGPSIDLAVASVRLGRMLSNPRGTGFFAGNYELLGEIFGGGIFQGPGKVEAGATLFIRYNFIQPQARIVPYMQIGGGGIYTDISERESRGLVSLPLNFNLQGDGGLRFMLNRRDFLLLEAGYRHVSNASIKLPNRGVDSVGGEVGVGFFF
jgi:lipid A 3-O-deacylase